MSSLPDKKYIAAAIVLIACIACCGSIVTGVLGLVGLADPTPSELIEENGTETNSDRELIPDPEGKAKDSY